MEIVLWRKWAGPGAWNRTGAEILGCSFTLILATAPKHSHPDQAASDSRPACGSESILPFSCLPSLSFFFFSASTIEGKESQTQREPGPEQVRRKNAAIEGSPLQASLTGSTRY